MIQLDGYTVKAKYLTDTHPEFTQSGFEKR